MNICKVPGYSIRIRNMYRVFESSYSRFLPLKISTQNLSKGFSSVGDGKLSGKVAVVTGSTEGIGFAIAQRLARDGAKVVVSSRKQNKVDSAVEKLASEGLQVMGVACHVAKEEDRKKLLNSALEKNGAIDILVSNAGTSPYIGTMLDTPESAWDKIFEINVKASFLFTKEVVPIMEKSGGGSIVYISSIAAYQSQPMIGAYSVSKTALLGLTRAMAEECASTNIRVNCVCPGFIRTKFSEAIIENPDVLEELTSKTPMKRIGEPHECAGIVSFLCSNDASYITGENIVVGGGIFAHL